ncbi:MAG: peroxiredoxin [Ignavibacteriae bacterium]|nr:peroxiredoxin [Ignavibacteria bacterium]MBI3363565.1 peroxiredoxin [Ignavibacteriota bacterium]
MALRVGDKAPEFTLYDAEKKERLLREFLGKKTVLAFYPGAFTGVCTKEMCTFRDSMTSFGGMGAHVVGISVDPPFSNKAFAAANDLSFPLLSDFNRDVIKKYDVIQPDLGGVKGYIAARRAIFVLDTSGIIRYEWISEQTGVEPPYDEIAKALEGMS